ncbi:TPA: PTS transporter subunit EIIC [Escherichia coli]|nr:PTS transporter subunit EIIC [Escherichia coli]
MTAKTAPKVTLWEFFQQLGKTFMLPVALLSFCGIMLGIGSSLSSHDVITLIPVLGNPVLQAIFTWMSKIGSFAFSFLPVMFCIAIPLGLARENKGVLLLPFGLHHILVALIRFTDAGGTQEVCGQTVSGALTIFQAQLSCPTTHGFSESATRFLSQGKMPAFLGGLPGAALAMYHCARPENRHKIKGLLISGLIACVVGGTTEPLEFLFLFVAPVLYVIHALLTGLGFTVMSVLGVTIGNTDGNIIDFVVFGILHGLSTKWYMVPVVAAIWFVVYYVIFRFAITRFNLKTPGRDSEVASSIEKAVAGAPGKSGYNVPAILEALGGADNIVSLDNCITRLRLSVKDMSLVNVQALKDNRAIGVVQLNQHNLQVVIGPQVQSVKDEMVGLMRTVQA